MTYDPQRHHRRSIRLPGYDYTQAGAYFVTLCTHNRECLFGDVVDGTMRLNEFGKIVESTWHDLVNHVAGIALDAFVVMPNHVHGIVIITDDPDAAGAYGVGAGSEPAPTGPAPTGPAPTGPAPTEPAPTEPAPTEPGPTGPGPTGPGPTGPGPTGPGPTGPGPTGPGPTGPGPTGPGPTGPGPTGPGPAEPAPAEPAPTEPAPTKRHGLPEIVRQLKTFSARRINEHRGTPGMPVWQRNYYEHIIRNDVSLHRIRQYITNNPLQWALDRENPDIVGAGFKPAPTEDEPWRI